MTEQVIDPARPILTIKDREFIIQGHRQTYAEPNSEALKLLESKIEDDGTPEAPPGDPKDTNLLPYKPLAVQDLQNFRRWCGPISGSKDNTEYTDAIGASILKVTDAYIRQICLFVNSHSPVRNRREDYPTMAYLPHDFWNPPTDPPTEAYIEERAEYIRTTARLPPQRITALTHLFIHITSSPKNLDVKPESALMVITPRAATIEYFDQMDHPDKHHRIGNIMNVISRVDPTCHGTWLELADWKCRAGQSGGQSEILDLPAERKRSSQIWVCTSALGQALGHDVGMLYPLKAMETMGFGSYDFLMWRQAMVIVIDLYRGYFSNVFGDPQYKPRVKIMFGHRMYKEGKTFPWVDNSRQRRNGSPWLHFSEKVYRRLLPRELAQWNGSNAWRNLDEEGLYHRATERMRHPNRKGRYYGAPKGTQLGEFGEKMKGTRARRLRMWLEDVDANEGKRIDRYHSPNDSVGWFVGSRM
ncbi:predicted protein [Sclerotinia sclerotiorum 1980 UF-70]|uniref:Uncharacterized protein n=2 Tax=Sclerotinia sclerotiorum (strain ATCC 18683 / 1980 / Ss-1) TaxID=665079 RepID=A0A1D9QLN8_SCLS1|nr:predicted protein [Sclerotinia sclerotiorum 1980 UF-70]APA15831.1 hypothetical protein sscle_15g106010 [Sclerotinia sclerotiorum 1980 UF-70]EDN93432.1 predicted protein [Sclerotinia sclerotiorum 1980 UF-70]